MEADARLRKKPPPDVTGKTLPLMLFVLDSSQPAWPWSQLEPLGFGTSRVWMSRKTHGGCYGEQIDSGDLHPTCQQMVLGSRQLAKHCDNFCCCLLRLDAYVGEIVGVKYGSMKNTWACTMDAMNATFSQ